MIQEERISPLTSPYLAPGFGAGLVPELTHPVGDGVRVERNIAHERRSLRSEPGLRVRRQLPEEGPVADLVRPRLPGRADQAPI